MAEKKKECECRNPLIGKKVRIWRKKYSAGFWRQEKTDGDNMTCTILDVRDGLLFTDHEGLVVSLTSVRSLQVIGAPCGASTVCKTSGKHSTW